MKTGNTFLEKYPELNKLPGASPDAFYYWHQVDQLLA